MNPFKWLQRRRQKSRHGISVPADWMETKEYLARIAGHEEPRQAYYGRQSLALFLEHGFASGAPGQLTEAERTGFVTAIASSRAGQPIGVSSLPDVRDAVARERFRNWVFNVVRKDRPVPPSTAQELLLTSVVYSSETVLRDLTAIYRFYSPQDGASKLHDLTAIARSTGRRLGELGPFVPSLATLVTNGPAAFEDLLLVPCLMQNFLYTRDLYVLSIENRPMAFLSKLWWNAGIPSSLSFMNVGEPIAGFANAVSEVTSLAQTQGRRVETLYQP